MLIANLGMTDVQCSVFNPDDIITEKGMYLYGYSGFT